MNEECEAIGANFLKAKQFRAKCFDFWRERSTKFKKHPQNTKVCLTQLTISAEKYFGKTINSIHSVVCKCMGLWFCKHDIFLGNPL